MAKRLPKFINIEEYYKIQKYIKDKKPPRWEQYQVAIMLGFEAGLRISEIVGFKDKVPPLSKDKIDFQANTIRVESGKGQKDRIVPLPKNFKQKHLGMLPLNLSRRALQTFSEKVGRSVLDRKISFHTFRHGFGSHLAERGRPLHEIQMLMGHSRMATTGIYLHANPKKAVDGAREVF
jgi:site-specific recombinase XerD